jgi:hypothetical protein
VPVGGVVDDGNLGHDEISLEELGRLKDLDYDTSMRIRNSENESLICDGGMTTARTKESYDFRILMIEHLRTSRNPLEYAFKTALGSTFTCVRGCEPLEHVREHPAKQLFGWRGTTGSFFIPRRFNMRTVCFLPFYCGTTLSLNK